MHCAAPVPEPPRLPRRLCGTATTSRLVVGSDPGDVSVARRWAAQVSHSGVRLARDVAMVVSELVTNSHAHTASGLPGGTTRVEIERLRFQLAVRVTDDGPRPGEPPLPHGPALVFDIVSRYRNTMFDPDLPP
ncbi:ATP-binding protein [Nocardiopsis lucentensis]|uniref:ATP-binding protein n=1 Tax=Nocardiopsis lucentensis TaxID=53441 RepID=UPI00034ADBAE|nr:ATP-binding protein [Nocardiopsis lucentensis]